jgi:hypothetical protein
MAPQRHRQAGLPRAKLLKKVEVTDIVANCVEKVGEEQVVEFAFLTVFFRPYVTSHGMPHGRPCCTAR